MPAFDLEDASFVTFRGFSASGGTGGLAHVGGERNTLAGCALRNAGGGITVSGTNNRVLGNDVIDAGGQYLATEGGDARALVPSGHWVHNNHFAQAFQTGAWQIRLSCGDRFSHNLLHDAPGQLLLPGGPLTLIDGNEVFNTGYQEGDGGVMCQPPKTSGTRRHVFVFGPIDVAHVGKSHVLGKGLIGLYSL